MERFAIKDLEQWKNKKNRKPLLLYGARQVGKTWLVRDFAKKNYRQYLELNFFTNEKLKQIFDTNISPDFLIMQLELLFNTKIEAENTLLFFDEIQESQRAIDALKTFNDLAPQYHIIAAGSFLGVSIARQPVGQVDHYTLYPMNFCEFLKANNQENLANVVLNCQMDMLTDTIRELFEIALKTYFFVGGMPEVVQEFVTSKDLNAVRDIQKKLLAEYKGDFSKHIEKKDTPRVKMLWDSIPLHIVKENKKFVYKNIKQGGRAAEFETAMQWLVDTGLIHKLYKVENPLMPLSMHYLKDCFKIFMIDIGLFCAQADIKQNVIFLVGSDLVSDMNGALAEQFVLQELKSVGQTALYYWGRENPFKSEIDFLTELTDGSITPIEVKSATNTKAKSLKNYIEKYHPQQSVRSSLNQYRITESLYDVPLYMISQIEKIIKLNKRQS